MSVMRMIDDSGPKIWDVLRIHGTASHTLSPSQQSAIAPAPTNFVRTLT